MTEKMPVRVGVDIPQTVMDKETIIRYCQRAEELGFSGLWTMDDAISATTFLDGVELLAFAAAVTNAATLGIAVLVIPRQNPALVAKRLATIDNLSDGRLIVGIGLGHDDEAVSGLTFPTRKRGSRSEEAIAVMKAFWTEAEASHDGEHWRFSRLPMEPKPIQQPYPPIWIGAGNADGIRRAARVANGWVGAGSSTTAQFSELVILLRGALKEAGRDSSAFSIGKRIYIAVDADVERARERVSRYVDASYGRPGLGESVGAYGSVSDCAEAVRQVIDAGARNVILSPVDNGLQQLEFLAEIAATVQS